MRPATSTTAVLSHGSALQSTSASPDPAPGIRQGPEYAKLVDISRCIGCKGCEVACKEWNELGIEPTENFGSFQSHRDLSPNTWLLMRFNEVEVGGDLAWFIKKDACLHCAEPGCLFACPAPGAIVQYENGIVDVDPARCIGCGYCLSGCPFDVPRFHAKTGKMAKCTLCVDRVGVGLEPACVKACPTGCLHFGTKDDMLALGEKRVEELRQSGFERAALYDPPGVGGTAVVTVLAHGDHPEWYGLPGDPRVPLTVSLWKRVVRPLGVLAILGAVVTAFGHYVRFGPREPGSHRRMAP